MPRNILTCIRTVCANGDVKRQLATRAQDPRWCRTSSSSSVSMNPRTRTRPTRLALSVANTPSLTPGLRSSSSHLGRPVSSSAAGAGDADTIGVVEALIGSTHVARRGERVKYEGRVGPIRQIPASRQEKRTQHPAPGIGGYWHPDQHTLTYGSSRVGEGRHPQGDPQRLSRISLRTSSPRRKRPPGWRTISASAPSTSRIRRTICDRHGI